MDFGGNWKENTNVAIFERIPPHVALAKHLSSDILMPLMITYEESFSKVG